MHMSTAQYSSSAQQHRTCYGPKEGSCRCAPVHCCTYVQTVRSTCMQHAYTEWLSPRVSKTGVDKARASAVREMRLHSVPLDKTCTCAVDRLRYDCCSDRCTHLLHLQSDEFMYTMRHVLALRDLLVRHMYRCSECDCHDMLRS